MTEVFSHMSTLYRDIKTGMSVEIWQNSPGKKHTRKKGDEDIMPESRNHGFGKVIFVGPHFITVQMPDGRKETISRNDIIDNHAQVRETATRNRR